MAGVENLGMTHSLKAAVNGEGGPVVMATKKKVRLEFLDELVHRLAA